MENNSQIENNTVDSQSSTVICKKRHWLVTAGIWLMIIINAFFSLTYCFTLIEFKIQPVLIWLSTITNLSIVVFAVILLKWKKWGFYGFLASNLISQFILAFTNIASYSGWLMIIILWAILQIKKDGVSCWKQLE